MGKRKVVCGFAAVKTIVPTYHPRGWTPVRSNKLTLPGANERKRSGRKMLRNKNDGGTRRGKNGGRKRNSNCVWGWFDGSFQAALPGFIPHLFGRLSQSTKTLSRWRTLVEATANHYETDELLDSAFPSLLPARCRPLDSRLWEFIATIL